MCIVMKEEKLKPNRQTQSCSVLQNTQRWITFNAATKGTCLKTVCMIVATVVPSKSKEVL